MVERKGEKGEPNIETESITRYPAPLEWQISNK